MASTTKVSGSISTENLVPAGAATALSAVATPTNGDSGMSIQVTGTYTGALSIQGTIDGTTWVTMGGTPLLNITDGVKSATIATGVEGIFYVNVSGLLKVRVTALAAVTGEAAISLIVTDQAGVFFLASETGGEIEGVPFLGEENTFTESQKIQKTADGSTANLLVNNSGAGGTSSINVNSNEVMEVGLNGPNVGVWINATESEKYSVMGVAAQTVFAHLWAFGADAATPSMVSLITSNHPFDIAGRLIIPAAGIEDYANDAAAEIGGVPVLGMYHTSGTLKIRLA